MMRKISLLSVLLIAIGIFPTVAATSSLSGKVVDQTNKAIVGVKVNLIQSNKTVSTLTTSSDGS